MFARSLLLSVLLTAWINLPLQLLDARETSDFDLKALTLEELINVEVSLASRKKEKLFETAAAAFVLSRDDIRRSGVTSIPEALRLVPGMQVGHIDANKWAVSARGFNDRFAPKLLVLIDGRNIYSPLFSGVFWEGQCVCCTGGQGVHREVESGGYAEHHRVVVDGGHPTDESVGQR